MRPTLVESGAAALEALRSASRSGRPFALVLLDAHMPIVDGFGVAQAMTQHPELAGATIMMLTSGGQYGDATRCRELGISAYLTKPVKQSDLFDAITKALEGTGQSRAGEARSVLAGQAVRPLKVLLAEDNVVNQRVAVGLLQKRGHVVTIAQNGREAVHATEQSRFDVVLMDVQMPEMGGFDATAAIRARETSAGGHLRIIAMTAHAMAGDRERCLASGMDEYLSKPIDPARLFSLLESAEAQPEAERPARTVIDRKQLLARVGGDQVLLNEVVQLFLSDCPVRLAAIRKAVESKDSDLLRREAHTLKGAAASLSATGLAEAAAVLERIGAEKRIEAMEAGWRRLSSEATDVIDVLRQLEAD
jgi:CheY-like chemotaxis protein